MRTPSGHLSSDLFLPVIADAVVSLPQLRYFDSPRHRVVPQVLYDLHTAVPFRDGHAAPEFPALQPVGHPLVFAADLDRPVEPYLLPVRPDLTAGFVRLLWRRVFTVQDNRDHNRIRSAQRQSF